MNRTLGLRLFGRRLRGLVLGLLMRAIPPTGSYATVYSLAATEGNAAVVVRELSAKYPNLRVFWIMESQNTAALSAALGDSRRGVDVGNRKSPLSFWRFLRSRLVFFTHPLYGAPAPASNRFFVNLWHGDGPKTVLPRGSSLRQVPANVLVTGVPDWGKAKARAFGVDEATLEYCGNPRIDDFARPATDVQLERLGLDPGKRLVLWAPTYRSARLPDGSQWKDTQAGDPFAGLDWDGAFGEALREAALQVVVKPHPLDTAHYHSIPGVKLISDVDLAQAGITPYAFLGRADVLITDYSSIWTDYLCLDRPVIFFCPDLAEYSDERGLLSDSLVAAVPGPVATTLVELAEHLGHAQSEDWIRRRATVVRDLSCVAELGATQRLLTRIERDLSRSPVTAPGASEPRRNRLRGRGLQAAISQGVSSVTNLVLSICIARSVGVEEFGIFGVLTSVYWFCLGGLRSLLGEPMLIESARRGSIQGTLRAWVRSGFAISGSLLVIALVCQSEGLAILGLGMPVLLLQDGMRYLSFTQERPTLAVQLDVTWLLSQLLMGVVLAVLTDNVGLSGWLLLWLGACAASLVVGLSAFGSTPFRAAPASAVPRRLRRHLALDFTLTTGMQQVLIAAIPLLSTLEAAGGYKSAQVACGPLPVLIIALGLGALPSMSAHHERAETQAIVTMAIRLAGIAGVIGLMYSVALLLLPERLGVAFLGESWRTAEEVAWIFGLHLSMAAVAQPAILMLRATGRTSAMLKLRMAALPLTTMLSGVGLVGQGLWGLAVGSLAGGVATTFAWWLLAFRSPRDRSSEGEMSES